MRGGHRGDNSYVNAQGLSSLKVREENVCRLHLVTIPQDMQLLFGRVLGGRNRLLINKINNGVMFAYSVTSSLASESVYTLGQA